MIDQACTMCANDNLELACAFVQKTATEKAVIEIDKYLKSVSNLYYLLKILLKRKYCSLYFTYLFKMYCYSFFIHILFYISLLNL